MCEQKQLLVKQKNMLAKAVIVFVLFMLLVYAVGLWMNISTQNLVRRQMLENNHLQLTYLAESLDREIEQIFRQQVTLRNDFMLRRLLVQPDLSDMGGMLVGLRRISGNFNAIYNSSSLVSDVGVYFPNLNRMSRWGRLFSPTTEDDMALFSSIQNSTQHIFPYEKDLILGMPLLEMLVLPAGEGSPVSYVRFSGDAIAETLEQKGAVYGLTIALLYDDERIMTVGDSVTDFELFYQTLSVNSTEPYLLQNPEGSVWVMRAHFPLYQFELVALQPNTQVDSALLPTTITTVALFAISMIIGVIVFAAYVNRLIKQIFKQKKESDQARLGQLHLKITPHFLYNSFHHIYRLGKMGDTDTVTKISLKLSQYYQYITRSKEDIVTLRLEAKHAEDYAAIQSIRSGEQIECFFEPIPEDCADMKMPKLFLQPLIENAYLHGADSTNKLSRIHVGFVYENHNLLISVENDGNSPDADTLTNLNKRFASSGRSDEISSMFNILQRLEFMYGDRIRMEVSCGEMGGLRIEIEIRGGS